MRNGYCAIGIILFVISKYTFLPDINGGTCTKLYNILDESQKKIYLNIFREKRRIYYISIVIGILLSFFYYNHYKNKNVEFLICRAFILYTIIHTSIYFFIPKPPSITYSLTTKKQLNAWQDIRYDMKNRFMFSFIIGMLASHIIISSISPHHHLLDPLRYLLKNLKDKVLNP